MGRKPQSIITMLEILALLVAMMAHKGGRKGRRKGYRYLPVEANVAIGALADEDVITGSWPDTVDQDTWAISLRAAWSLIGITTGEGTMVVGVAHSDYTAAEIEECLEVSTSWDRSDKIAQERRKRKVRIVGSFPMNSSDETLEQGLPITTKLGFKMEIGESLQTWAWNRSASVFTTGMRLEVTGGVNARTLV